MLESEKNLFLISKFLHTTWLKVTGLETDFEVTLKVNVSAHNG
jgi:hypothetical protein